MASSQRTAPSGEGAPSLLFLPLAALSRLIDWPMRALQRRLLRDE